MRSHMEDLKGLLFGMGLDLAETRIPTPYGILKPPLSITRLKAVELVSIIVLIQDPQCCQGESTSDHCPFGIPWQTTPICQL